MKSLKTSSAEVWQPSTKEQDLEDLASAVAVVQDRRKSRESLLAFTEMTFPKYRAELFHSTLASVLDEVVAGSCSRLMVYAPPQHGKSELVSVRLPAFWLGRRPDDPVIIASYGSTLAESKSRQVRDIIESKQFGMLFPGVATRSDTRAVGSWGLQAKRGGVLAVGVGGAVTGHGAMLGIIDDPLRSWADAQSKTIRDKTWDWYRATFRTRIWEGGAIVLIMTRWHPDDLAGRLLREEGEAWRVIRFPAIAETPAEREQAAKVLFLAEDGDPLGREPGEPLCPGRFSLEELHSLKRTLGSVVWAAEYQGTPSPPEGNRISRASLQLIDISPRFGQRVRYWDKAGTEGGGCFTAGVRMLRDNEGRFYIEDVVSGQWSALERERIIKQTAEMDALETLDVGGCTQWLEQEPGSGGKESAESTVRNLAGLSVRVERVTGSKEVRAEPFIAQVEARNVWLVRGAWNSRFIDEAVLWPNGKYKDQIDAAGGALNKLARGTNYVAVAPDISLTRVSPWRGNIGLGGF